MTLGACVRDTGGANLGIDRCFTQTTGQAERFVPFSTSVSPLCVSASSGAQALAQDCLHELFVEPVFGRPVLDGQAAFRKIALAGLWR